MGETIEAGDTADREGLTIGEWLTRAIVTQVQADLADLERMITLAEKIASANGQPIPPGITRATYALMRDHLRDIRASRTASPRSRTVEASG